MVEEIKKGTGTISVRGKGHVEARPDEASLTIGVEKVSLSQEDASEDAARFMNSVINILRDIGIAEENIKSKRVSISPYKKWSDHSREYVVCGGKANHLITVRLDDISLIGTCFDRLSRLDGIEITDVTLGKKDKSQEYSSVRKMAYADAHSKALVYAEAAEMTLGKPVSIRELDDEPDILEARVSGDMDSDMNPQTQYHAPDLNIDVCVGVVFEMIPLNSDKKPEPRLFKNCLR